MSKCRSDPEYFWYVYQIVILFNLYLFREVTLTAQLFFTGTLRSFAPGSCPVQRQSDLLATGTVGAKRLTQGHPIGGTEGKHRCVLPVRGSNQRPSQARFSNLYATAAKTSVISFLISFYLCEINNNLIFIWIEMKLTGIQLTTRKPNWHRKYILLLVQ